MNGWTILMKLKVWILNEIIRFVCLFIHHRQQSINSFLHPLFYVFCFRLANNVSLKSSLIYVYCLFNYLKSTCCVCICSASLVFAYLSDDFIASVHRRIRTHYALNLRSFRYIFICVIYSKMVFYDFCRFNYGVPNLNASNRIWVSVLCIVRSQWNTV